MASSQGMLNEGKRKRKREDFDGVEVSVMECFINSCQCQPIHPFLVVEEQSSVYQNWCILASSASLLVLGCSAHSAALCERHWERGMALGMMSLHNSHLTHAW